MEGGNGATIGSGITQFANGEPKRWNYDTSLILPNRNSITAVHRLEMSLVSGCSDVLFAVPEPSTWALLALGVVALFLRKRVRSEELF